MSRELSQRSTGLCISLPCWWGAYSFFHLPQTVVLAADNPWLLWLSLAGITGGGLIGVITVATGTDWIERYGAGVLSIGLGIYWIVGLWLVIAGGGSRRMSAMTTTFTVGLVVLRFYWTNDRPFHPDRADK